MSQESFADALQTAYPPLLLTDDLAAPPPPGHTTVSFAVEPIARGVRLTIRIGGGKPYRTEHASEQEAARFLGRLLDPGS